MPIAVQDLNSLTQDQIDTVTKLIVQMVQEHDPTVDVKRGPIYDLVLHLSSILTAANQADINNLQQSNSLLAITINPALADPDLVAAVASNYRVTQGTGTLAQGPVVVILNAASVVVVPVGTQFLTSSNLVFAADNSYTSRVNQSDVVTTTDRLLVALGNGLYAFTIGVVSSDVGSIYKLAINTSLTPPLIDPSMVRAYTAADFTGGMDAETTAQLATRLQAGISNKSLSNRDTIEGLIQSLDLSMYDYATSVSSVGFGDEEQTRYHSIFPIAFGGRVDTYVRTQATAVNTQLTKTATYLGPYLAGPGGIWQIQLSRDDAPGYYEVSRITLPGSIDNLSVASYSITGDVRGFDLSVDTANASTTYFPDVANTIEATYSRYQTGVIQFIDTDTSTAGLVIGSSTNSYSLIVVYMPGIAAIQDAVSDRESRSVVSDCLIKAPVPCFMSITMNIGRSATTSLDISSVPSIAAKAVNSISFIGKVPASAIVTAVQSSLIGASVTSIIMQGSIRKPNGVIVNLTSTTLLDASSVDTANMVSSRTVAFFLNPEDVHLTTSIISP